MAGLRHVALTGKNSNTGRHSDICTFNRATAKISMVFPSCAGLGHSQGDEDAEALLGLRGVANVDAEGESCTT